MDYAGWPKNEISLFCILSVSLKMEKNQDLLLSIVSRYSSLPPPQTIQGGVGNNFPFLPSLEEGLREYKRGGMNDFHSSATLYGLQYYQLLGVSVFIY